MGAEARFDAAAPLTDAGRQRLPDAALATPCGGCCRRKRREFGAPDAPALVGDGTPWRAHFRLGDLLPAGFGPQNLAR